MEGWYGESGEEMGKLGGNEEGEGEERRCGRNNIFLRKEPYLWKMEGEGNEGIHDKKGLYGLSMVLFSFRYGFVFLGISDYMCYILWFI